MDSSSENPNPESKQTRELNLQKSAEQFMVGIQRHFDMLAFNLASRENASEKAYQEKVQRVGFIPVPQYHQNYEQMQAYSRDLLYGQVLNDNLQLAVSCLNQVHLFLTLIKAQQENQGLSEAIQKEAQEAQQAFVRLHLDQKFNTLEETFGVMSELEDGITSLGMAFQALSRQGGIVKEAQLDENKELVIEMKVPPAFSTAQDLGQKLREMETTTKVFRDGEKIAFSDEELQRILLTTAAFAHQLFSAVARFARDMKEKGSS